MKCLFYSGRENFYWRGCLQVLVTGPKLCCLSAQCDMCHKLALNLPLISFPQCHSDFFTLPVLLPSLLSYFLFITLSPPNLLSATCRGCLAGWRPLLQLAQKEQLKGSISGMGKHAPSWKMFLEFRSALENSISATSIWISSLAVLTVDFGRAEQSSSTVKVQEFLLIMYCSLCCCVLL